MSRCLVTSDRDTCFWPLPQLHQLPEQYRGPVFFGILAGDRLYFKTDKETEREYKQLGSKPFLYKRRSSSGRKKQASLHSYFEVPANILEDQDQLTSWARKAVYVQENILAKET